MTLYILGGVTVPITPRFSERIRASVASGQYEASERSLLEETLRPGDRLLELGSGCGYLATVACRRIGSARVVTVEADPGMAGALLQTFIRNGVLPSVICGIVARDARPHRIERAEHFWGTKAVPDEGGSGALPLSGLIEAHRPTVLLCDIEGGEEDLLGEPLPGIRAVIIESHGNELRQKVRDWLLAQGFTLKQERGKVGLFVKEPP